jgi:hypothetical protein
VRNLFALVWLLAPPRRSKELKILVLRHELARLPWQGRQPKLTRADRGLLAALSLQRRDLLGGLIHEYEAGTGGRADVPRRFTTIWLHSRFVGKRRSVGRV